MDDMPDTLSTSTTIDRPASEVWSVVSDLRRMSEFSPYTAKVFVLGKGPIGQGTSMVQVNKDGWKVWPTRSTVEEFEPGRRIAFRVPENKSLWIYELTEQPDGSTLLTETRDMSQGSTKLSATLVKTFFGGYETFDAAIVAGMDETLAKIKAVVERN